MGGNNEIINDYERTNNSMAVTKSEIKGAKGCKNQTK